MLSNKRKCYKKTVFRFQLFLAFLLAQKQQKLTKNEENWQNLNCLIKFSEIWYVDASHQKKMLQKNRFSFSAFFGLFWPKTTKFDKNEENWQNTNCLMKFSEIWYCRCFPTKENATKKLFFVFSFFWHFCWQKNSQNCPKMKKIGKIQTNEIF